MIGAADPGGEEMRKLDADERTTLGALDVEECLVLLRWEPIARLAYGVRGESPIVVPVNIAMTDDRAILFRSDDGTKLDRIREQPISLQADRFDWFRQIGWSVLVRGVAHEYVPAPDAPDPQPWAPGAKQHWVRVEPTAITGRRLELTDGSEDRRGYL